MIKALRVGSETALQIVKQSSKPTCAPHEVRIRVKACALSELDIKARTGQLPLSKLPLCPGFELSGEVDAIGSDVTHLAVGDEVAALVPVDSPAGGCAEFSVQPALNLVVKPDLLTHEEAAASLLSGLRAYTALHYQLRLRAGELLLFCAPNFGADGLAVQLAGAAGARVVVAARGPEQISFFADAGAHVVRVVDLDNESLVQAVMEESGGLGADCILDLRSDWNYTDHRVDSLDGPPSALAPRVLAATSGVSAATRDDGDGDDALQAEAEGGAADDEVEAFLRSPPPTLPTLGIPAQPSLASAAGSVRSDSAATPLPLATPPAAPAATAATSDIVAASRSSDCVASASSLAAADSPAAISRAQSGDEAKGPATVAADSSHSAHATEQSPSAEREPESDLPLPSLAAERARRKRAAERKEQRNAGGNAGTAPAATPRREQLPTGPGAKSVARSAERGRGRGADKRELIACLAVHLDPPNSAALSMRCASLSFLFAEAWLLAPAQHGKFLHIMTDLLDKVAKGVLRPAIARRYRLDKARQAHRDVLALSVGKVVISC